jgi:hypothetical protein
MLLPFDPAGSHVQAPEVKMRPPCRAETHANHPLGPWEAAGLARSRYRPHSVAKECRRRHAVIGAARFHQLAENTPPTPLAVAEGPPETDEYALFLAKKSVMAPSWRASPLGGRVANPPPPAPVMRYDLLLHVNDSHLALQSVVDDSHLRPGGRLP